MSDTTYVDPWLELMADEADAIASLPEVVSFKLTPKPGELGRDRKVGSTVRKGQLQDSIPGVRMTHYIHDEDRKSTAGTVLEFDLRPGADERLRQRPTLSRDGTVLKFEFDLENPDQVAVIYKNVNAPVNQVRATLPK